MPCIQKKGNPYPFGATPTSQGINFAIFSLDPSIVLNVLCPDSLKVLEEVPLFKTGNVYHIFLEGASLPFAYAYRTKSASSTLLLDPYAKALKTSTAWNTDVPYAPIGLVLNDAFDWKEDKKPNIAMEDLVLYEMHVRGFTQDPAAKVLHPGSFLGIIEKIDHFKSLGINALEIMPLQEFDQNSYKGINPITKQKLYQYWGYSTVNFFCPMNRFASSEQSIDDFKTMVAALHRANIEVIIDIVLNHTSEGNEQGPIQSFKGLAPEVYYLFTRDSKFINSSGCGNTLNCNHPVVIEFILDVLRYWVTEMHVDGFRFDLASIFYRGAGGRPLDIPPVLSAISEDPILANIKLIAEPWDAEGLYHVGHFFTESVRWAEWNGRYRDIMRRFLKGDKDLVGKFATRLSGSEDLYGHHRRHPQNSINFITCHDGFTLRDLVSYNGKHNLENGEDNRDGSNQNDSWNCGAEGDTEDQNILSLRQRQMRNFHMALMVSQGVPLLHMGDEYGHTKKGNNNTWCQDNALNWFQWEELEKNESFFRFYKGLIHFRNNHPVLRSPRFLTDEIVEWHGVKPSEPNWGHDGQFIAFTLWDQNRGQKLYIAFNASQNELTVTLPALSQGKFWNVVANTSLPPPHDFFSTPERYGDTSIKMLGHSSLLLIT